MMSQRNRISTKTWIITTALLTWPLVTGAESEGCENTGLSIPAAEDDTTVRSFPIATETEELNSTEWCEWIVGDNCWKDIVEQTLEDCAPGGDKLGVASEDRKSCSFEDDVEIEFGQEVPDFGGTSLELWGTSYTIKKNGEECAHVAWEASTGRVAISVGNNSVGREPNDFGANFVCSDGVAYSNKSLTTSCGPEANVLNGGLPVQAFVYGAGSKEFAAGFYGVEREDGQGNGGRWLFRCDFEAVSAGTKDEDAEKIGEAPDPDLQEQTEEDLSEG